MTDIFSSTCEHKHCSKLWCLSHPIFSRILLSKILINAFIFGTETSVSHRAVWEGGSTPQVRCAQPVDHGLNCCRSLEMLCHSCVKYTSKLPALCRLFCDRPVLSLLVLIHCTTHIYCNKCIIVLYVSENVSYMPETCASTFQTICRDRTMAQKQFSINLFQIINISIQVQ